MTRALAETLAQCGVPVRTKCYNAEHGFFYDLANPVQREFFEDILAYLRTLP